MGVDRALICEDDAVFKEGLGRLTIAPNADIVFANTRLSGWCSAVTDAPSAPLKEVIKGLAALGGPKSQGLRAAPGADCYLVTGDAAVKLLALTSDQKIACGVDWQMLWNGLGHADESVAKVFPELAILREHLPLTRAALDIQVLSDLVAGQAGNAPSSLRHSVTRPISELTRRESDLAHTEYVSTISLGGIDLTFAGRSGPDPVMESHRRGELWDEPGLRALLRRFPQGGIFVDIGAHLGNHAVVMARLGQARRLVLVEPNGEILKLLRTNLAMNAALGRAHLAGAGIAAWYSGGDGWLMRNRRRSSETMVKTELAEDQREGAEPIRLVPGDTLLAGQDVDAIKIDTSGSEPEVLRGLTETMKAQRPAILVDHAAQGQERIARLADERGYRVDEIMASSRQNRLTSLLVPRPDGGR